MEMLAQTSLIDVASRVGRKASTKQHRIIFFFMAKCKSSYKFSANFHAINRSEGNYYTNKMLEVS